MSQLTHQQLAPLLDKLISQGVLYHTSEELMRQHMLATLQTMLPHMDEGCWERGCPMVDDFAQEAAMTDKLTDVMIAKAVQLVDDLCVVYCGYRTEDGHAVYRAADDRIRNRAGEVHKAEEIKRLAARIEELKGQV